MSFLIDGHNLIPKIPGLSLRQLDDEQALIELLQEFCRVKRQSVEVYFDQAPPGKSGVRSFGVVKAHFIRQGMTADDAIINRVRRSGRTAVNLTVVSSDHRIQNEVRVLHAQALTSDEFARKLVQALSEDSGADASSRNVQMSDADVEMWARLFEERTDTD